METHREGHSRGEPVIVRLAIRILLVLQAHHRKEEGDCSMYKSECHPPPEHLKVEIKGSRASKVQSRVG
jgi:hypothetical protein